MVWHHRIWKPPFSSVGVFKNPHSGERFWKDAFSVTVFTGYVWTEGQTEETNILVFKQKRIRVDGALMGEGWLELNYCMSTFIAGVKERTNQRLVMWKLYIIQNFFLFVQSVASVKRGNFRPHSKHLQVSLKEKGKISLGLLELL